jgi:predicted short-subunit dehydrogenase-like oxidoreductase (DUF2520 family)
MVIIGCGNLAWHLAAAARSLTDIDLEVYNHVDNPILARFKKEFKAKVLSSLEKVRSNADFYFLCVSDRAIKETASKLQINNPKSILCHVSGSMPLQDLGERIHGTAVFYPLQTFTIGDQIDWKQVPILLEVDQDTTLRKMRELAERLSDRVIVVKSQDRLLMHLSAVLVNNFTNALFEAAENLLSAHQKSLPEAKFLLLPLLQQTVKKLEQMPASAAQTGPAKRKDKVAMKKHLHLLSDHPELRKVYRSISKLIRNQKGPDAEL